MPAVIFAFTSAVLLFAGSTQIELVWLSVSQFILGLIMAISGALAGWTWAREL